MITITPKDRSNNYHRFMERIIVDANIFKLSNNERQFWIPKISNGILHV